MLKPVALIILTLHVGAPSAEEAAEMVAQGRGDAREGLMSLMRKGRFGLKALVARGRTGSGAERRRVYEAIGSFRTDAAKSALLEGLRAADRDAQVGAARGLGRQGAAAVGPLVQTAMTPDKEVRGAIVEALSSIGKPAVEKARKLLSAGSPYARETAVRFLARYYSGKDRRSVLMKGLRDREANVRAAAVELAELWKDVSLAEALVELSRDSDAEVASRAVEAVAKFPALRKELPKLLSDPRVTQQAWMTAFHRLRDYDDMAVPYLLAAIAEAGPKRRGVMLDILSSDASEKELQAFVNMLDAPEGDVTQIVTGLLGQMGARADTAAARMVLDNRESLVAAIQDYLSTRPRKGITNEILASAKEGSPQQRARHIEIIGELGPGEVREDLVDLLDDTETEIRVAAARALGGFQDVGAESELVRLLDDVRHEVRVEAVRGLKAYDSRLSVLARMTALEDPDAEVRQEAIFTFKGASVDTVLHALERVVRTGSAQERLNALTAIGEIKTSKAAVLLVDLVTDSDDGVKEAASAYFNTLPKLEPKYENAGKYGAPEAPGS